MTQSHGALKRLLADAYDMCVYFTHSGPSSALDWTRLVQSRMFQKVSKK